MSLAAGTRDYLTGLARQSIRGGFEAADPGVPDLAGAPAEALVPGASFVTLTSDGNELRGCRGTLEARRPLAADVWFNARASAFDDPRFPPVTAGELDRLRVGISVLGPLQPVPAQTEAALRDVLVPGQDGLVISWRGHRATFLPQVWESLPGAGDFLAQLKLKAGLPPGFWAPDIDARRYRVETLGGGPVLDGSAAADSRTC